MVVINTKTGKRTIIKRKYIPKNDYACEFSVLWIEDLKANLFPSAKPSKIKQLYFNSNREIKFHDVDDSIGLLLKDANNPGILTFGLA